MQDKDGSNPARRLVARAFMKTNQTRSKDFLKCLSLLLGHERKHLTSISKSGGLLDQVSNFGFNLEDSLEVKLENLKNKTLYLEFMKLIKQHRKELSRLESKSRSSTTQIIHDLEDNKNFTIGNKTSSGSTSLLANLSELSGSFFGSLFTAGNSSSASKSVATSNQDSALTEQRCPLLNKPKQE